MTCRNELIALGVPYPRTCQDCGLGTCKKIIKSKNVKQNHECPDWDFMEITNDDAEFDLCLCFPKPRLWLAISQDGRVKYTTDGERAAAWKQSGLYRLVRDYYTEQSVQAAVEAEREACAKVIDATDLSALRDDPMTQNWVAAMLFSYAAAIRARGQS